MNWYEDQRFNDQGATIAVVQLAHPHRFTDRAANSRRRIAPADGTNGGILSAGALAGGDWNIGNGHAAVPKCSSWAANRSAAVTCPKVASKISLRVAGLGSVSPLAALVIVETATPISSASLLALFPSRER